MNNEITFLCPAKINLSLAITGRRSDGYHMLDSVVVPIDWYDKLTITAAADLSLSHSGDTQGLPEPKDNLIIKAATRIARHADIVNPGAKIHLHKHLPTGAGLGGGSSNAAACLKGLNQLWQLGLDENELRGFALTLGADVPFFIEPRPARMQGIGEKLAAIELPAQVLLLLIPEFHCSATLVYQAHARLATPGRKLLSQLTSEQAGVPFTTLLQMGNHLAPAILAVYPVLGDLCAALPQAQEWRFSGSGSCLFRRCSTLENAQAIAARIGDSLAGIRVRTRVAATSASGPVSTAEII